MTAGWDLAIRFNYIKLWVKNPSWSVIGDGLLNNVLEDIPNGRLFPMGHLYPKVLPLLLANTLSLVHWFNGTPNSLIRGFICNNLG